MVEWSKYWRYMRLKTETRERDGKRPGGFQEENRVAVLSKSNEHTSRSKTPRRSRIRFTSAKTRSQIGGERCATSVRVDDEDDDEDEEDDAWW